MWCSQTDRTGMSSTTTSSSYRSALGKVVKSKLSEVSISAYASAIRRGVSAMPSDPMG
jgi:hypothetical protein